MLEEGLLSSSGHSHKEIEVGLPAASPPGVFQTAVKGLGPHVHRQLVHMFASFQELICPHKDSRLQKSKAWSAACACRWCRQE